MTMQKHKTKHNTRTLSPEAKKLMRELDGVKIKERPNFRRRIRGANSAAAFSAIQADLAKAKARVEAIHIPAIEYPELPVSARRDEIMASIRDNQVVIIAGETGSGKTTQIPKMCLDLGRGRFGMIGHTQPRRLAARSVAERIAEELGQEIGQSVGYAIRFDDRVGPNTAVKLMTDGIILAELARDPLLLAYDTLIIDEAHERSLNIDFLLGYIKQLLPQRPDLKVIITSATIDPERFAEHFDGAPIIEVSGRTYPVEVRYRPVEEITESNDLNDAVLAALEELMAEGDGDILCFFATEREIRDMLELIEAQNWRNTHAVPLFGRLSNEEQHRIFSPHAGRRIVLSTNIAETSLTVPGIHYVVDTGLARISRYSVRTKVQRLPIEPVSQASANQRSGRCGRIADGVAIRLYSEQDFLSRPEFTDPEILRTNLASVILQMESLGLGDIPFVQAPEPKALRDGKNLLYELQALRHEADLRQPIRRKVGKPSALLSPIGRTLAKIPVDPRLGRMLVAANHNGVLSQTLVIVAALSIQDVRERPLEFQAQADQQHARFKDTTSDFLSYLKLWEYIRTTRKELSGNQFRKRMKAEYLHYVRIREWMDLVTQLREVCQELDWNTSRPAANTTEADRIHQALLTGLLGNIGARIRETQQFQGARGTQLMIFPGSALAKKPPQFIMAAQIVETTRLWARDVAQIDPAWLEDIAGDLLRRSYSEPHWSAKRQAAMCYERCQLYGVTIYADRLTAYQKVDPEAARDMFIRNALVQGEWSTHHNFFHQNQKALARAQEVEEKARRRDLLIDDERLYSFYDARIPKNVTSGAHFNSWFKKQDPHCLDFDPEKLLHEDAKDISTTDFPDTWGDYELSYVFDPTDPNDGISMRIPVPLIAAVDPAGTDWLVPGMRQELVTELIRTLPKALRRLVVPAPDWAAKVTPELNALNSTHEPITTALAKLLPRGIDDTDFNPAKLPPHLRMNFLAIDKRGKVIDQDRDLAKLQRRHAHHGGQEMGAWDKDLGGEFTRTVDGKEVRTFPALTIIKNKQGKQEVRVKAMPTKQQAEAAMLRSTVAMLGANITVKTNPMVKGLPLNQRVALDHYPHGGLEGLINDARIAAIRDAMFAHGGPATSPEGYAELEKTITPEIPGRVRQIIVAVAPGIEAWVRVNAELNKWTGEAIDDMKKQLQTVLPPNAISIFGAERLKHLPRFMEAINIRMDDMGRDPDKDADRQDEVNRLEDMLPKEVMATKEGKEILWMLQEFRVSLFAQRLGTSGPVSARRIEKAIHKLGL